MKDWKKFVLTLYEDQDFFKSANRYCHFLGTIGVQLMKNGNLLLNPGNFHWEFEDIKSVDDQDPLY